jgi:hypothetical protein
MAPNFTRAELEQLPLRSVVAFGYLAVRRVRHLFLVPAYVPNPRKFHRAVDNDLEYAREFASGQTINVAFALRRMRVGYDGAQAGHDIIYAHGPFAFRGQIALENAASETRRAATVAKAANHVSAAVYHFSFSVLSEIDPEAVRSVNFGVSSAEWSPVNRDGWADNGFRWLLKALENAAPSKLDYERLLDCACGARYPALGEPIDPDTLITEQGEG